MKHFHSAGIIVYRLHQKHIEYLLLQYSAGHWDFSKGKIEEGETKEEAALRELHEEAGLSAQIEPGFEESFSYFFHDYGDKELSRKTVYFFVGVAIHDNVVLSYEHTDYVWLSYKEALEKLTFDNAKEVLKKANRFLNR